MLYRARVFEKSNFNRLVKYYLQESGYSKSDIEKILNEWTDEQKILSLMPEIYSDYDYNQTPELVKAQKKWKRYVKYKGWNAEDSGAPPADLIGNGRANPDHIRYLYLSEDPVTPVYEVRPIIGDTVSVAKFKLLKDVRLYDLTFDMLLNKSGKCLAGQGVAPTVYWQFAQYPQNSKPAFLHYALVCMPKAHHICSCVRSPYRFLKFNAATKQPNAPFTLQHIRSAFSHKNL